jgi:hypothetical protein
MSDRFLNRRGRALYYPRLLLSLFLPSFLLFLGCTAELAIVASPISAQLFQEQELRAARERGLGRVIVVPPGDPTPPGLLRRGVGGDTTLLLMPEVGPEEVAATEAARRLTFRLEGSEPREGELLLDRRPAFRRLGELLAEEVENTLEEESEDAETIKVRLFALSGSGGRVEELQALLEPLRRRLPPRALRVEEVATGFTVAAIEERLREAGEKDPILLILGSSSAELLSQAAGEGRLVVTEALFVPPEAQPLDEVGRGDLVLLGLDPLTLFEAALAGEAARLEAALFSLPNPSRGGGTR